MTDVTLWLSRALAGVAALAAAGTLMPGALGGTAVMNGSARGTALVVLVVAVPTLWLSSTAARRGSVRALAVWVGALAYLTYNAVMFLFATPFNPVFPLYVAMLSLAVVSLVRTGAYAVSVRAGPLARPVTGVAAFMMVVTVLNVAVWLRQVAVAVTAEDPTSFLEGSGLTTNPVIAQDLAVWLPLMAWLAWGLLHHPPRRVVLAAAGLVYWVVEGIGVAADQWLAHAADPGSDWASPAGVWLFLGLAVASATALARLLPLLHAGGQQERRADEPDDAPGAPQGWVIDSTSSASSSWASVSSPRST